MTRARELANFADDTAGLETLTVSDITDLTVSASNINSSTNQITDSSTDLNVDSNTLVVDKSADRAGIGTASPQDALHIVESSTRQLRLEGSAPSQYFKETDGSADQNYQLRLDGGNFLVQTNNDAFSSASTKLTIDQSGNVGIGGASGGAMLDVNGTCALGNGADISGGHVAIKSDGTGTDGAFFIANNDGTSLVKVLDNGKFGIGTNSPQSHLQVNGTGSGGAGEVSITRVDTSQTLVNGSGLGYLNFGAQDGDSGLDKDACQIIASCDEAWSSSAHGSRFEFYTTASGATSATERMRIDSSGNVGIGAASSGEILGIDKSSGNTFIRFDKSGTFKGLVGIADSSAHGSTGSSAGDMILRSQNNVILDTGGTTRILITSGGNVGVGTTSPQNHSLLHVKGDMGGEPYCAVVSEETNTSTGYGGFQAKAVLQAHYRYAINGNNKFQTRVGMGIGADKWSLYSWTKGADIFTVDGQHGYFDKNFGHSYAEGSRFGPSTESGYANNYAVAIASNDHLIRFADASGNVHGSIRTDGDGVVYNTSSDYRVKENVTPLGNALERLNKLSPKRFTWINYPELGERDGFIAHEVDEVVPEAVDGEKDRMRDNGDVWPQGLDMSKLIPLLTASIQELSAKVTALESA